MYRCIHCGYVVNKETDSLSGTVYWTHTDGEMICEPTYATPGGLP